MTAFCSAFDRAGCAQFLEFFISLMAENVLDSHGFLTKILSSNRNISFYCIIIIITREVTR